MDTCKECKNCVFWILRQCDGEPETCEYLETYDEWDYL